MFDNSLGINNLKTGVGIVCNDRAGFLSLSKPNYHDVVDRRDLGGEVFLKDLADVEGGDWCTVWRGWVHGVNGYGEPGVCWHLC